MPCVFSAVLTEPTQTGEFLLRKVEEVDEMMVEEEAEKEVEDPPRSLLGGGGGGRPVTCGECWVAEIHVGDTIAIQSITVYYNTLPYSRPAHHCKGVVWAPVVSMAIEPCQPPDTWTPRHSQFIHRKHL